MKNKLLFTVTGALIFATQALAVIGDLQAQDFAIAADKLKKLSLEDGDMLTAGINVPIYLYFQQEEIAYSGDMPDLEALEIQENYNINDIKVKDLKGNTMDPSEYGTFFVSTTDGEMVRTFVVTKEEVKIIQGVPENADQ